MRTSYRQYLLMVDFMEKNGDLSKPGGGVGGRHFIDIKWKQLTKLLNNEDSGNSRSEPKWRKVWSDLKNNTKKKVAKLNKTASGTCFVPDLQLSLTEVENKVMQIIGDQRATSTAIEENGYQQVEESLVTTENAMCTNGLQLKTKIGKIMQHNVMLSVW
ncbi:hypothetical protein evm_015253 [Chilo suppressalis]|nr:hypothetical protein evm_015253 [Chilo suppressalis]